MAREGKRIPQGMIDGVVYVADFLTGHEAVLAWALRAVKWDERIQARKTASYGLPYDYAGLSYEARP